MKRFISLLLMTVMVAMALVGCAQPEPAAAEAPAAEAPDAEAPAAEEPAAEEPAAEEPAAEDDWAYIQGKGKMVIGITEYAPMNYYDEAGKLIGFDTEYAEAVCAELGVTPEFIVINWDTKEVELAARSIDCIWNGFTITEERKEALTFSAPYVKNMQVVVIKASNADKYTDTASLASANLVAEIASTGEGAIQADENLSKATYVSMSKQADALLEVKAGTADAAVIDYVMARAMTGEGTDYSDLMMIEGLELSYEEYGIGFRKGSNVADMVNEATQKLIADGTLGAIAEKYDLALMAD